MAFYLLSKEVVKHVTVVQSGQGADEVFAGYEWYPPLAEVPRHDALSAYASVFFDWTHRQLTEMVAPEYLAFGDVSRAFVSEHLGRARRGDDPRRRAATRFERDAGR